MIARLLAWIKALPAKFTRMEGYWGGVTMRWRDRDRG